MVLELLALPFILEMAHKREELKLSELTAMNIHGMLTAHQLLQMEIILLVFQLWIK